MGQTSRTGEALPRAEHARRNGTFNSVDKKDGGRTEADERKSAKKKRYSLTLRLDSNIFLLLIQFHEVLFLALFALTLLVARLQRVTSSRRINKPRRESVATTATTDVKLSIDYTWSSHPLSGLRVPVRYLRITRLIERIPVLRSERRPLAGLARSWSCFRSRSDCSVGSWPWIRK